MTKPSRRERSRLSDSVEIAAGLRAEEMRICESEGSEVRRGSFKSLRRGLPPAGAEEGVTYHDVEVGILVEGDEE